MFNIKSTYIILAKCISVFLFWMCAHLELYREGDKKSYGSLMAYNESMHGII